MSRTMKSVLAASVIIITILIGVIFWKDRRVKEEENNTAINSARVLSATFDKAQDLRVGELNGMALAKSAYDGCFGWCISTQTTRAPFHTNYFVNLKGLTVGAFRWNERERVMYVDIPEVTIEAPNIDMARAEVKQNGMWISRSAGTDLQRRAARYLFVAAKNKSADPKYTQQARDSGRATLARLVAGPLSAAGLGQVTVKVRFPGEPRPGEVNKEQWDMSRSIAEVLAERR